MPTKRCLSRLLLAVLILAISGLDVPQLPAQSAKKAQPGKTPTKKPAKGRVDNGPKVNAGEKAGDESADNGLKMKLCWCPPGKFSMGRRSSEREVTLPGFWLGKTEVTQSQWTQLMGTTPWKGQNYEHANRDAPANYVSAEDAKQFCRKLTDQENKAGRLPSGWSYRLSTDEEWEYACRAGTTTTFSFGDEETKLGEYAWHKNNAFEIGEKYAHVVGLKKPNAWGLCDMHGNLWELCETGPKAAETMYGGAETGWVRRGGDFSTQASVCNSSFGIMTQPLSRTAAVGFRLALIPEEKRTGT